MNRKDDYLKPWTVQDVKDALPNVLLRVGKRTVDARTSGRLNAFATVSVTNDKPRSGVPLFMDYQFSWEAIVRSLNENRPLEV